MVKFHPILAIFWFSGLVLLGSIVFMMKMEAVKPNCYTLRDRITTLKERELWDALGCDRYFSVPVDEITQAVSARSAAERFSRVSSASEQQTVIALVVHLSSDVFRPNGEEYERRISFQLDAVNLPVYKLWNSLVTTAQVGYHFVVYAVYDEADDVYDNYGKVNAAGLAGGPATHTSEVLRALFSKLVASPLSNLGVNADLVLLRFANRLRVPGPALGYAAAAAAADAVDYITLVPEDVLFSSTAWAGKIVGALSSHLAPPNLGVVGATCITCAASSDKETLQLPTFHAKTHFDIFGYLWPPSLAYGLGTTWLTRVYGGLNSRRALVLSTVQAKRSGNMLMMPPSSRGSTSAGSVQHQFGPRMNRVLNEEVMRGVDAIIAYLKPQVSALPPDPARFKVLPASVIPGVAETIVRKSLANAEETGVPLRLSFYERELLGLDLVEPDGEVVPVDVARAAVSRPFQRRSAEEEAPVGQRAVHDALADYFVVKRVTEARQAKCAVSGSC